ncbi:putative SP-containing protein [Vairimorpha necatrix]|uniref:SP-containing protein n=1 Tax=Vairimorpha necatrix TaxID=6039 RepID=A0AAX4JBL5_9MICR
MLIFVFLSIICSTTLSVDYTSFLVKSITEDDTNKIKTTKNILNYQDSKFFIPLSATDDTFYYPLNSSSQDLYNFDSYETNLSINDINGLFISKLSTDNIIISVRDYNDKKTNEEFFNALKSNSSVTILPASLAAVSDLISSDLNVEKFGILSTQGHSSVFIIYEVLKTKEEVLIKTLVKINLKNFGDVNLDQVIEEYIRGIFKKEEDVCLVPLKKEMKEGDLLLDIYDMCLDIKKKIIYDVETTRAEEPVAVDKNDEKRKKPIEGIIWNFKEIKEEMKKLKQKKLNKEIDSNKENDINKESNKENDINKENDSNKENENEVIDCQDMDKFVEIVNEHCKNHEIFTKYLISSYNQKMFQDFFNFEDLVNVQDSSILKGALKFQKSIYKMKNYNLKSTDKRIIHGKKMIPSKGQELEEEIRIKKECEEIIKKINETEGKYFQYLPETIFDQYKQETKSDNEDINGKKLKTNLNLKDAKDFLTNFKKLERQNQKHEKDILTRPIKLEKLEEIIKKAEINKTEVWWNDFLEKKLVEYSEYLERVREDKEILGDELETKAYTLEGFMSSVKNNHEKKIQEEAEKTKEEQNKEEKKTPSEAEIQESLKKLMNDQKFKKMFEQLKSTQPKDETELILDEPKNETIKDEPKNESIKNESILDEYNRDL